MYNRYRKFSFVVVFFHPSIRFLTAKKIDFKLDIIFGQKNIFIFPELADISWKFHESLFPTRGM
jgi:hypothetical protein